MGWVERQHLRVHIAPADDASMVPRTHIEWLTSSSRRYDALFCYLCAHAHAHIHTHTRSPSPK